MLIVIAIMGIVSAIAIPRINTTQFHQDAGARITRTALQIAGRLAVTRQYDIIVSFDVPRSMMRIAEDMDNNGAVDSGEHISWKALEDGAIFAVPATGLSGTPLGAIDGSGLTTIDGMPSMIFRRNGATSTAAVIYIGSVRNQPHDFRAVTVAQSTGRTDWYRYANAGWKEAGI
jgi:Tfp pilus assembly protein FimT